MSKTTKIVKTSFLDLDFIDLADKDYITARLLTFAGKSLWRQAAYHSHQALEKYLKALLVKAEGAYLETHILDELVERVGTHYSDFNEKYKKLIEKFDESEQVSRYGPFANFDPLSKVEPGKFQTKDVFVWNDIFIKDLDQAVFLARKMIDFSDKTGRDNLIEILKENKKHWLVAGWKLPGISILDVLTSHNDSFKKKTKLKNK